VRWHLALLVFAAGLGPGRANAKIFHVDQYGAYQTIQAAADSAANGDTLVLAPGTYVGNPFLYRKDLLLRASHPGLAVLDADHNGAPALWAWSSYVRLDGLVLRHGTGSPMGVGIMEWGGRVDIRNCVIEDNDVGVFSYRGMASQGALDVQDCRVVDNGFGVDGSLYTRLVRVHFEGNRFAVRTSGMVDFSDLVVIHNGAPDLPDCGAVAVGGSYGRLLRCEIRDNFSSDAGASGIWASKGPFEILDCQVTGNVSDGGPAGVAIDKVQNGLVRGCTISGNRARGQIHAGAGLTVLRSTVRVQDCTIDHNDSDAGDGGGVSVKSLAGVTANVTLDRCRILGNSTAGSGGGVLVRGAHATLREVVLADNAAGVGGGGIATLFGATLAVRGTTVAANRSPFAGGLLLLGARADVERSLIVFHAGAAGIYCQGQTSFRCVDVFGNGSDSLCGEDLGGNLAVDPLFCGFDPSSNRFDLRLASDSPVASGPQGCGLLGALPVGCEATMVRPTSWGEFKSRYRGPAEP